MSDEGGRKYYNNGGQSWESSGIKFITYKYKDFQKRADMYAPPRYVSVLNEKSIILQQIKSGTIIGYGYCSPLFDLEEIKTLSKLEVKHK